MLASCITEEKVLHISLVNFGKSVNEYDASTRPASRRENSKSVLTNLSNLCAFRWISNCRSRCSWLKGLDLLSNESDKGPSMRARGVRNSWLMFVKKAVFALSKSTSCSALCAVSSAAATCTLTKLMKLKYSSSKLLRGDIPQMIMPKSFCEVERKVNGITTAFCAGSGQMPPGSAHASGKSSSTTIACWVTACSMDQDTVLLCEGVIIDGDKDEFGKSPVQLRSTRFCASSSR